MTKYERKTINMEDLIDKLSIRKVGPLASIVMAIGSVVVLIAISSPDPIEGYRAFAFGVWGQKNLAELFLKASPILLVALGAIVAFKCRVWNIGFEGQMYIGAILGTFVVIKWLPNVTSIYILLPLVLLAGFAGGAAWSLIAGILKVKLNVNEIIITLMMIYIAIQLNDMLLFGPLRQPMYAAPQSPVFPSAALMPIIIPDTRFHLGIIIAIILVPVIYILLSRTSLGFQLQNVGLNVKASHYAGTNVNIMMLMGFLISGGFAGLAGMMEVCGVITRLTQKISPGYGFIGIAAALLGRLNPVGAFFAALLFAAVMNGAKTMSIVVGGASIAMVPVIQGVVVLIVLAAEVIARWRQ